ncbi:MAG: SH3 domain-containing protein, partial [Duncaniella sp.]|nr:SH3 domain-containing protein [Duncaniella sp.]
MNTNSKFCPNCGTAITVGQQPSIAESPSVEQSAETLAPPTPISASTPPSTSTPVSDQTFLAEQTMTTEFTSMPEVDTESDRRRKNLLVVGSASAAVLLLGLIIYFCAGGSSADNKFTDRHKVMADNLFFRSSPSAQTDANIMARLPYGSSVTLISTDDRWAEVECDGKHGYVGIRYILPDSTFRRLDQVWASSDVRDIADQNRYRQAIATYLESNHLETGPESWTIPYGNYKDAKPNTILSINLRNGLDKFPELAFILHNNSSGERRLIIYSFNPTDESPILIHEEISGYEGMIKDITLDR